VFGNQRAQHINQQASIAFGLKDAAAHAGSGGRKEKTSMAENVLRGRIAARPGHAGAKAHSFLMPVRHD